MSTHAWREGRLIDSGLNEPPLSWMLVPPEQSNSGHVEVMLSAGQTILTLDALERIDQVCLLSKEILLAD